MARPLSLTEKQRIEWVKSFESGQRWFGKLRARRGEKLGTLKKFALCLQLFCEYVKMNPDEIIDAYKRGLKEDVNETVQYWNDTVELFYNYILDTRGIKRGSAVIYHTAVKSFFSHNAAVHLTTKTPEFVSGEIPPISMDDLQELLPQVNPYHRFMILFLKDSGISQADALRLTLGDLKAHKPITSDFIRLPADPSRKILRAKEGVKYETFIGPNTIEALKTYLQMRRNRGEKLTADSPLFVTRSKPWRPLTGESIRSILSYISKKTGITISTHRLRKHFETYLALAKVHPVVLKYWMGHKIRTGGEIEGKYIIPPTKEQMELYRSSYRFIDVTPKAVDDELITAQIHTILETLTPKQRREYVKKIPLIFRGKAHTIFADPKIKSLLKEKPEPVGGMLPAEPEYKQIREKELLVYLQSGWKVEYKLASGNVIVVKRR